MNGLSLTYPLYGIRDAHEATGVICKTVRGHLGPFGPESADDLIVTVTTTVAPGWFFISLESEQYRPKPTRGLEADADTSEAIIDCVESLYAARELMPRREAAIASERAVLTQMGGE